MSHKNGLYLRFGETEGVAFGLIGITGLSAAFSACAFRSWARPFTAAA